MCFQIFQNEKALVQAIKKRTSKRGKIAIFPKGLVHGFGQKLAIFFKGNIGQENVFYDILERKNAFLGYKNKKFEKRENSHFSKEVQSTVLVKNLPFFHLFFKDNIGKENVFYNILQRKNVFLSYKNKKFKKSKNCLFLKGVSPWFWSKIGHFSKFFPKAI